MRMSEPHLFRPRIPERCWVSEPNWVKRCGEVDLRLKDGSVLENMSVNRDGVIVGKLVPYPVEIDESATYGLRSEDIAAYRIHLLGGSGMFRWIRRLGITKWRTCV
jgi:hypothetical protein